MLVGGDPTAVRIGLQTTLESSSALTVTVGFASQKAHFVKAGVPMQKIFRTVTSARVPALEAQLEIDEMIQSDVRPTN